MRFQATHEVDAPRELVWEWHTRPGALTRLSPPFMPMEPLKQAERLSNGTTILGLPAGLKWVARHDLSRYQRGYQFCDVCVNAPLKALANWRHIHSFSDVARGRTLITDTVDSRIPPTALESVFAYRQRQLINDFDFLSRMHSLNGAAKPLVVAMTGSRGGVGTALRAQLTTAGHEVIQLVRGQAESGQRSWDPQSPAADLLDGVDVLVHLAGEPIFGRFNESHKNDIRESRVGPTKKLAKLVASSETKAMVCASAIGIYGPDRGDEPLTEESETGEGFLAEVVRDWEAATTAAKEAGKRVVSIRTGVSLSGSTGLLPLLKGLFLTGLGGAFGSGDFWFSWISHDDLTDIYFRAIVDESLNGPVNAVAPNPVLNRDMAKAIGNELNRPAIIPVPTFGPALLLGKEGARELALADQKGVPARLEAMGHTFRYPTIEQALAHELGGEQLVKIAD